jgi:hypothetical protein
MRLEPCTILVKLEFLLILHGHKSFPMSLDLPSGVAGRQGMS